MIVRVAERRRFTIVDNVALEDARLSWRALGVLVFLLSRPDNWQASYRHLATLRGDGEDTLRKVLKELEGAGYIERHREKGDDGRFVWVQVIYENPQVAPCGVLPGMADHSVERHSMVNHSVVEPVGTKKEEQATDEQKEETPPSGGKPKASDRPSRRVAERIVREWWDARTAQGQPPAQPYIAVVKIVEAALVNGVTDRDLAWALGNVPTVSGAAIEYALSQRRGRGRRASNADALSEDGKAEVLRQLRGDVAECPRTEPGRPLPLTT